MQFMTLYFILLFFLFFISLVIMVYEPIYHNLQIVMVSVRVSLNLKGS